MRKVILPAQYLPSFDKAMDKLITDATNGEIPEWGTQPCKPGEVLEITVRRVQAQRTA
jgi:hypothetical protein